MCAGTLEASVSCCFLSNNVSRPLRQTACLTLLYQHALPGNHKNCFEIPLAKYKRSLGPEPQPAHPHTTGCPVSCLLHMRKTRNIGRISAITLANELLHCVCYLHSAAAHCGPHPPPCHLDQQGYIAAHPAQRLSPSPSFMLHASLPQALCSIARELQAACSRFTRIICLHILYNDHRIVMQDWLPADSRQVV